MGKLSTESQGASRVTWDHLEEWVREKVQELMQALLEEEVTELLGRGKSARRQAVDPDESGPGYRNSYGKERRLTLSCGAIKVRRPRVRGLEQRFESRVLLLSARRTREVDQLIPELYLHGLAAGDFDLALRGLLGEDAPISASTVARLKEKWQGELKEWKGRSLAELEVAYLWVDGVYVKAGLEKEKAVLLVVLGGLSDGRKVLLALESGYRESTESWLGVLRDLKGRGMDRPKLVVGDGNLGLWGALGQVFPEACEQRCWNHKMVNVLDKLPKKVQWEAKGQLQKVAYAPTLAQAEQGRKQFVQWCAKGDYKGAAATLERDWGKMVSFYQFPKDHWRRLRTTNPIESPFATLRLRTDAAKWFKKVENATAVIFKMLLLAEGRFRRLNAPERMKQVYLGAQFQGGIEVKQEVLQELAA
ncbi:MAG: IS256 family transposase [Dehalococcoidia bacterium]|nr:IS256 family transposase [Dehalococcoidia bacterium]